VVWGNGSGYMTELQDHFPKPPKSEIGYAFLFDGDKRLEVQPSRENRWPALFLPTELDPDDLFRSLRRSVSALAGRLNVPEAELARFLDTLEALNAHDWVNDLGARYGRVRVLRILAELWVESNEELVEAFLAELARVL
jgi:hypothetical protein